MPLPAPAVAQPLAITLPPTRPSAAQPASQSFLPCSSPRSARRSPNPLPLSSTPYPPPFSFPRSSLLYRSMPSSISSIHPLPSAILESVTSQSPCESCTGMDVCASLLSSVSQMPTLGHTLPPRVNVPMNEFIHELPMNLHRAPHSQFLHAQYMDLNLPFVPWCLAAVIIRHSVRWLADSITVVSGHC